MIYRLATDDDVSGLRALWDLGRSVFDGAPDPLRNGTFDEFRDRIACGHVLVAEEDGELLGMLGFDLHGDTYVGCNVAVTPKARGKGVGRALILVAHAEAQARGARNALAIMWNEHPWLKEFYEGAGYKPAAQMFVKELR